MELAELYLGQQCAWNHLLDDPLSALLRYRGRRAHDGCPALSCCVRPLWTTTADRRPCGQRPLVFPGGHLDSSLRGPLLGAASGRGRLMKQAALGTGLILAPLAWFASLEANFALAPLACGGRGKGLLLAVS